jgi:hypothetical protein
VFVLVDVKTSFCQSLLQQLLLPCRRTSQAAGPPAAQHGWHKQVCVLVNVYWTSTLSVSLLHNCAATVICSRTHMWTVLCTSAGLGIRCCQQILQHTSCYTSSQCMSLCLAKAVSFLAATGCY